MDSGDRKVTQGQKNLEGLRVLVTAGPTREYFDPVRFLSNPSSGKMGFAIADAARKRGARVTLISGPVSPEPPANVRTIRVVSAEEMHHAVLKEARRAEIVIMAAAVSDYRPAFTSRRKIKKRGKRIKITLVPTRDILMELGRRKRPGQILVGFAAETDHLLQNARRKLREKNLDWIIANRVGSGRGFESDRNRVVIIPRRGKVLRMPLWPKKKIAGRLLDLLSSQRRSLTVGRSLG